MIVSRPFKTVFFDCDSTLVRVEGIDELARLAGASDEVARLTEQAMNGSVPLEEVYGQRLAASRPDREALEWLAERYVETVVEGAAEVIAALHALDKDVHVISGGLRAAVERVAIHLGVPAARIHAVPVRHDPAGRYAGFDEDAPLARAGGKIDVCRAVLANGGRPAAIVGDGATDLEARDACDAMIGFGGVAAREDVRKGADEFVVAASMYPVLARLATEGELARLASSGHRQTVERARSG